MSVTVGYYWMNASWGVTESPGKYKYMVAPGKSPVETYLEVV